MISSMINALQSGNISDFLISLCYSLLAMLPALILHEIAHGWVALKCGDPTAKMNGRLTLNPLSHLDPIGSISMLLIGFGWAKAVPVNPYNFRNRRRDMILVSLAGICMNLILFLLSMIIAAILSCIMVRDSNLNVAINLYERKSILQNLMNGYSYPYLFRSQWLQYVITYFRLLAVYNISLAIFNFLPIPPLDGSRFWNTLLFNDRLHIDIRVLYASIIFIFLLNRTTGIIDKVLSSVSSFFMTNMANLILSVIGVGG